MTDIQADIEWYGRVYSQIGVTNKFEINNESPEMAVKRFKGCEIELKMKNCKNLR